MRVNEAEHFFNDKDYENLSIIKDLVRDRFSLDSDSFKYFSKEIFNPTLDDKIYEAFDKFGSSRIYLDLPLEIIETLDNSWAIFKNHRFREFVQAYKLNYKNFKENKVQIKKNTFKLKKAILNFYEENLFNKLEKIIEEGKYIEDFESYTRIQIKNYFDYYFPLLTMSNVFYKCFNYSIMNIKLDREYSEDFNSDEIKSLKNEIKNQLSNFIESEWKEISRNRLSSNNLKLVLSINYADWFLCSTKENWTSCLSLNSSSANYWYGLPGLIGDKNRIMMYITDGTKKEYKGIETDRFIYRSWALMDDINKMFAVRWFPKPDIGSYNFYKFIEEKTGLNFEKNYNSLDYLNQDEDFHSKHPLTLIYADDNTSLFPYLDFTDFTEGEDTYIISGESGMLYKNKHDYNGRVYSDERYSSDAFLVLDDLIERDTTITTASENFSVCEDCGEPIRNEDDGFVINSGETVCESCFERNYFVCDDCGEVNSIDISFNIPNGIVCELCFQDNYFFCELSEEVYDNDFMAIAAEDRNGKETFVVNYEIAESKGYILNEEDNIYYKSEYMILTKNGDYIHVDDFENQLELEEVS